MAQSRGLVPNLKRGENRSDQNHVFREGSSKRKPNRLSDEGVENNVYKIV